MSETAPADAGAPPQSPAPAAAPTQRSGEAPQQTPPAQAAVAPQAPEEFGNLLAEARADTEATTDPAPEADTPDAPVDYTFDLPEGIAKDDPLVSAFTAAVAEAKLPKDAAQAVMSALAPKVAEALQAPYRLWTEAQARWQAEVKADPEIGGTRLQPTLAGIAKMLDDARYCDPGLRDALTATGAGNHPAVIRSFAKLAQAVTEGGMVPAGKPAPAARSAADVLYPSMTS